MQEVISLLAFNILQTLDSDTNTCCSSVRVQARALGVDRNRFNLSIGGVKAYNLDNRYNRSGSDQHFKIFVGFQNTVCTNLCIATVGYQTNLKVKSVDMLRNAVRRMLQDFNAVQLVEDFKVLHNYELTEQQFAQLIGR